MVEGIAAYGVGFKLPSMHELRTWILKEEVGYINTMMEEHKKAWAEYGCTIMSDGWTDGKNRVLINFLVNSPAVKLMEKRKKLWWTPCAAHCIDLMLEDISKMKVFEDTIRLAKQVVKFIYRHTWVLALMRSFTKNKEIIRPAITRFSTSYLTLQSINKQKQPLQAMFYSRKWHNGPFVQHNEVSVLRELDSEERSAMGFIYELMDVAKEKIAFNYGKVERKYKPIWRRMGPQLHQPLHAGVRKGLEDCMTRMLSFDDRMAADIQLDLYDEAK
ncbi:unnamed protein product [Prunus armeniaca]